MKGDLSLRHLPVYLVSTTDSERLRDGIKLGAQGILPKPIHTARQLEQFLAEVHTFIDAAQHSVLVVDADPNRRAETAAALERLNLKVATARSGEDARPRLRGMRSTPWSSPRGWVKRPSLA